MRHILMAAAAAAMLTVSIGAAEAFPVAPVAGVAAAPEITLVSGGCGPYRHRGPYGGCRPGGGGFFHPGFGYRHGYGPGPFHRRFHPYGYRRHFF
jgi:hypothetical protein